MKAIIHREAEIRIRSKGRKGSEKPVTSVMRSAPMNAKAWRSIPPRPVGNLPRNLNSSEDPDEAACPDDREGNLLLRTLDKPVFSRLHNLYIPSGAA